MSKKILTESEARELATAIKSSLVDLEQNLRYFHSVQGWLPLGYDSFTTWWDNEMGELPIANSIRNWAIYAMIDENTTGNRVRSGMTGVMAHATGLAPSTISGMKSRRRPKVREISKKDDELVPVSIVIPARWHRHMLTLSIRKDRPMSEFVRLFIKEGMLRNHGIDLDKPTFEG